MVDKKVNILTRVIPRKPRSKNYQGSGITNIATYSKGASSGESTTSTPKPPIEVVSKESYAALTDDNVLSSLRALQEILKRIISSTSDVEASDENTYSALKIDRDFKNIEDTISELDTRFLRKDQDDSTEHLLQLLGGAEFGEYVNSLVAGKGAAIDKDGKAQVESLEVRSYLKVMELIYNRLSATEGDIVFTESGLIEKVEKIDDTTYRLTFRKRWDNDFIAFHEGDILRGIVNNLTAGGEYYTAWSRVLDINLTTNTATVVIYPDTEVEARVNYAPTEKMIVHRWGNAVDKSRQTTWYLSSTEGRIMFLNGVRKPILEEENHAAFWGKPLRLKQFEDLPINYDQPYAWMRGLIVQDLFRVDYKGQVIKEIIDAGPWQQGKEYKNGEEHPYQQHDVWLGGNRWRCLINNTTEKPRWNSPGWIPIGGNQLLSMKLANTHGTLFRPGQVYTSFIASVYFGDIDITADIEPLDWQWLRETSNPNADLAWIEAHKEATNQIEITDKDIDPNYRNQTRFICKAYVRLRDEITELRKDIIV